MLRSKWKQLQNSITSEHVFAIGDIHGHATPLSEALEIIARTPSSGQIRHLIFTGDTIDRGPENIRTAELVETSKELAAVDKVTILPGNHEIMLSKAIKDPSDDLMNWSLFGGVEVLNEIDPDENVIGNENLGEMLQKKLSPYLLRDYASVPTHVRIDDVLFVHAGLAPTKPIDDFLSLPYDLQSPGNFHWAWIRGTFLEWKGGWAPDNSLLVVHGHSSATENLIGCTSEMNSLCMLDKTHQRINLDVGAGYEVSQIAMAEFLRGQVRLHVFQDETFRPASGKALR